MEFKDKPIIDYHQNTISVSLEVAEELKHFAWYGMDDVIAPPIRTRVILEKMAQKLKASVIENELNSVN